MLVEPRHHTPRSDWPTRGGQVALIAQAKGRPFMPWQRLAADVMNEYDPDTGLPRYGVIVMSVQRQAGKTTLIGDTADHRCIRRRNARVWITMQNGKMADSWMRNEHLPSLRAFGDPSRKGCEYRASLRAGEVGPIWPALNSTFYTFPPKRDALHSKQSDLVIISEAWALSQEQGEDVRQAARPTMATRPGAQLMVESTMGDDASTFLDSYIELGVASLDNPNSRVCIIDYGLRPGDDPEDLDVIGSRHPAYGHTVSRQSLEDARAEFKDDVSGWARAYGNVPSRTRTAAFPPAIWAAAGTERTPIPERFGLAFDVTPRGHATALVASWRVGDLVYGEVIDTLNGCGDDVADYIAALSARRRVPVGYDAGGVQTLDLADRIAARHPRTQLSGLSSSSDRATACGGLARDVMGGLFRHFRQPALDQAVANAARRPSLDGGFVWTRKDSGGPIAELYALTVARRMHDTLPPVRSFAVLTSSS